MWTRGCCPSCPPWWSSSRAWGSCGLSCCSSWGCQTASRCRCLQLFSHAVYDRFQLEFEWFLQLFFLSLRSSTYLLDPRRRLGCHPIHPSIHPQRAPTQSESQHHLRQGFGALQAARMGPHGPTPQMTLTPKITFLLCVRVVLNPCTRPAGDSGAGRRGQRHVSAGRGIGQTRTPHLLFGCEGGPLGSCPLSAL